MGNSITKQQPEEGLGLHKFRLMRVIGRGSFGKVRIVEHKETHRTYALKYISKAGCIQMKSENNILRERDILEEIDHPFVVNLRFSFQDEFSMFMVLDLMIGGDLRFHMLRRRFVEGVIKFWIAEIASAINYLHTNHNIVHRDIKPDNILMDDQGHVALTDFNIATRIDQGKKHYSVAGTANYMAPEVVSGVGYTYSVDWWSLGVVMYECVYGKRPFRHRKHPDELKMAILQEEIQFPMIADVQVSYDCISAMRGFLSKDPDARLGCGSKGFERIKQHPFFSNINWNLLEARQIEPPFVPNCDQSNFDISHDLEEMLLEQEPLEAKKRKAMKKLKTPPEHSTPEYQAISREFAAFDYIEYERFKGYIDTHGSINACAADAVRAAGAVSLRAVAASAVQSNSPSELTVPLSQIKLDGRPIINLSLSSQTPSPASSSGRSRSTTATIITGGSGASAATVVAGRQRPVLPQLLPVASGNSSGSLMGSDGSAGMWENHPLPPLPPVNPGQQHQRQNSLLSGPSPYGDGKRFVSDSEQLATLAAEGGLFSNQPNHHHQRLLRQRTASISPSQSTANSNSSNNNTNISSSNVMQQHQQPHQLLHPITVSTGTLEPPNVVPIDILTWNQMLPEQRSLAHRFCIKMAHDRQRHLSVSQRKALHALETAIRPNAISTHRHTPSGSVSARTPEARFAGASSSTRKDAENSGCVLTASEKRQSLMRRQHSAENLSALSQTGAQLQPPSMAKRYGSPENGLVPGLRPILSPAPIVPKQQQQQQQQPLPPLPPLPLPSHHIYQNQPLPPPPQRQPPPVPTQNNYYHANQPPMPRRLTSNTPLSSTSPLPAPSKMPATKAYGAKLSESPIFSNTFSHV